MLIAAGCLAQRYQGDLFKQLPELDGVVGTGEFGKIAEICRICWRRRSVNNGSGSASLPICMTQTPAPSSREAP